MAKYLGYWQFGVAVLVSVVAYMLAGPHGAVSALAGSFSVLVGSALAMLSARQIHNKKTNPGAALMLLLRAEAIKIVVIVLLLWMTFRFYAENLVPAALIAGLAIAAVFSGAGIMRVNEKSND
jgi:ATP synthase protein I